MNTWRNTILSQIQDLEMIASWASITNFGRVRDLCRLAQAELKRELESDRCREDKEMPTAR